MIIRSITVCATDASSFLMGGNQELVQYLLTMTTIMIVRTQPIKLLTMRVWETRGRSSEARIHLPTLTTAIHATHCIANLTFDMFAQHLSLVGLVCIGAVICHDINATPKQFYVDPVHGSDAGAGTQTSPFRTIAYAANVSAAASRSAGATSTAIEVILGPGM